MTADSALSPAWIASRLSPAQRDALMWLPGDGSELMDDGNLYDLLLLWPMRMEFEGGAIDVTAELADFDHSKGWRATPLGLRVRAVVAGGVDG